MAMETKSKKKREAELWTQHMETIRRLFISENKTIDQVQAIMAKEPYNLKRTNRKAQFQRAIKQFGIRKNLKELEWKSINYLINKRAEVGKQSTLYLNGNRVSDKKVLHETKRQGRMSTLEKMKIKNCSTTFKPVLPDGVIIRTPSPISIKQNRLEDCNTSPPHPSQPTQAVYLVHEFYDGLPWTVLQQHIVFGRHPNGEASQHLDEFMAEFFDFDTFCSDLNFFIIPKNTHSTAFKLLTDALNCNIVNARCMLRQIEALIPWTHDSRLGLNVKSALDASSVHTRAEFFKLVLYLLSNNIDIKASTKTLASSLVPFTLELLHHHHNREILQALLASGFPSVRSFSERILFEAIGRDDIHLVQFLFECNIRPNSCSDQLSHLSEAHARREHEMAVLTALGLFGMLSYANPDISSGIVTHRFGTFSSSDQTNLMTEPDFEDSIPAAPQRVVNNPFHIPYGLSIDVISHIIDSEQSEALIWLRKDDYSILEIAAEFASVEVIEYLVKHGDHSKIQQSETYGKALVAATSGQKIDNMKYLLSLGADPNSHSRRPRLGLQGFDSTSLFMAAFLDRADLAEFLLKSGALADPEPPVLYLDQIRVTALQIAAGNGNEEFVQLLIDFGADLDVFSYNVFTSTRIPCWLIEGTALSTAMKYNQRATAAMLINVEEYKGGSTEVEDDFLLFRRIIRRGMLHVVSQTTKSFDAIDNNTENIWSEDMLRIGGLLVHYARLSQPKLVISKTAIEHKLVLSEIATERKYKSLLGKPSIRTGTGQSIRAEIDHCRFQQFHRSLTRMRNSLNQFACMNEEILQCLESGNLYRLFTLGACEGDLQLIRCFIRNCHRFIQALEHKDVFHILCTTIDAGHIDIVETLIKYCKRFGILPGPSDGTFQELTGVADALLYIRADFPNALEMAHLLIGAGADVSDAHLLRVNGCVFTLFQKTVYHGQLELAQLLAKKGANPNMPAYQEKFKSWPSQRGYSGRTALQRSAELDLYEFVDYLLKEGVDANAIPAIYRGRTALQFAAANGNFAIVHRLLENGANINALPAKVVGLTALEGACLNGRLDMARFLLNAGSNIAGLINPQYRRAVGLAWNGGHRELAEYIQQFKEARYGRASCQSLEDILAAPDVQFWNDDEYWVSFWNLAKRSKSED